MSIVFFIPLICIALWESMINDKSSKRMQLYFGEDVAEDEDDPELQDPKMEGVEDGEIVRESFADLIKVFPKYVGPTLSQAMWRFELITDLLYLC